MASTTAMLAPCAALPASALPKMLCQDFASAGAQASTSSTPTPQIAASGGLVVPAHGSQLAAQAGSMFPGAIALNVGGTMAFPPGVTVKDYTWGGSQGYLNPKRGAEPARFRTIIQIVPVVQE